MSSFHEWCSLPVTQKPPHVMVGSMLIFLSPASQTWFLLLLSVKKPPFNFRRCKKQEQVLAVGVALPLNKEK